MTLKMARTPLVYLCGQARENGQKEIAERCEELAALLEERESGELRYPLAPGAVFPRGESVVCVGKYRLYQPLLSHDTLLIEHESGERMEVSTREAEKVIERFYDSRF